MASWRFWKRWFGGRRMERAVREEDFSSPPPVDGTSALVPAETGSDTGVAVEEEDTAPLRDESRRAAAPPAARVAAAGNWPDRQEIASLREGVDEAELARVIGRTAVGAGPEEVLFRYHLSRAIYFGEHDLPPLPQSAARVLELSRSPMAGVADYAKVVEADPGMVRSVLWLANSSFYTSMAKCTSLAQAMVRIGIREVERIALMQAFQAKVFKVYGHDELVTSLGAHGLSTALSSQAIARQTGAPPADAFLGGLFHDVGKLVVLGIVAQVQRKLKRRAPTPLITSAFEAFHEAIGESACRHWQMPEAIVHAVAHHHNAPVAAEDPLDRAVYLGNLLAHGLESKDPSTEFCDPEDPALLSAQLAPRDLAALREQTALELKEYQRVFA